eukprot:tig00020614_g12169.t1
MPYVSALNFRAARRRILYTVTSVFFVVEYLLQLMAAADTFSYVFSWIGVADLLSALPILDVFVYETGVLGIFRLLSLFRISRLALVFERWYERNSAVHRELVFLGASFLTYILLTAAFIEWMDGHGPYFLVDQQLSFHESLYFIIVTMATVGYGDIAPKKWESQVVVMAIIIFAAIFFPMRIGSLITAMQSSSRYAGPFVRPLRARHVLLAGRFSAQEAAALAAELLAPGAQRSRETRSEEAHWHGAPAPPRPAPPLSTAAQLSWALSRREILGDPRPEG